jgi:hypothetical protein
MNIYNLLAWHLLHKLATFVKYKLQQKERKEMKKTEALIKPELVNAPNRLFDGKNRAGRQQRQQSVFAG